MKVRECNRRSTRMTNNGQPLPSLISEGSPTIRPECAGSKQPALLQEESGHRRAQCHHSGLSADEQVLQRHGSAKHSRILAVVRRELQPKRQSILSCYEMLVKLRSAASNVLSNPASSCRSLAVSES
jgi:hypothetical protein